MGGTGDARLPLAVRAAQAAGDPGAAAGGTPQPELPLFLQAFTWVELRDGITEAGLDSHTGTVHAWTYAPRNGGFWARDNLLYPEMRDGRWQFDIPKSWKLSARQTRAVPAAAAQLIPEAWRKHLLARYGSIDPLVHSDKPLVLRLQDIYVPLELSTPSQLDFLDKWFRAVYGDNNALAIESKDKLWDDLEKHDQLPQLKGTPLLLSMIATTSMPIGSRSWRSRVSTKIVANPEPNRASGRTRTTMRRTSRSSA